MTYLINGVALETATDSVALVEGTMWRPDISVDRSPVSVPGRHGTIESGLPVYGEGKLTLVIDLQAADSPTTLEQTANVVTALLAQPSLTVTRVSGGITATTAARLESVSQSGFLWGRSCIFTAVLALPGVFLREAPQVSAPLSLAGGIDTLAVAHLAGSSAPIGDAVARFTGPLTNASVWCTNSATGLWWAGLLPAGQYLYLSASLRAWRSASASQWTSGGTDVSAGVSYPPGGPLQLCPRVTSLAGSVVEVGASAVGFAATTAAVLRAGRSFL